MNKLFISPAAEKDLLEIKQYISEELDNPTSAVKVISQITNRIKDLVNFPEAGIPLSTKIGFETKYRFIVSGNYLAFYRFEENSVYIDRVLYAKRDYIRILLLLEIGAGTGKATVQLAERGV